MRERLAALSLADPEAAARHKSASGSQRAIPVKNKDSHLDGLARCDVEKVSDALTKALNLRHSCLSTTAWLNQDTVTLPGMLKLFGKLVKHHQGEVAELMDILVMRSVPVALPVVEHAFEVEEPAKHASVSNWTHSVLTQYARNLSDVGAVLADAVENAIDDQITDRLKVMLEVDTRLLYDMAVHLRQLERCISTSEMGLFIWDKSLL